MAKKAGKHIENARKKVEARPYRLQEASELIKKTHHTKFNETVNSLSIWVSIRSIPTRSFAEQWFCRTV